MFCIEDMEYGSFPMDFPVPENFSWIYPTRCGYQATKKSPAAVSGEHSALFLYLLSGEGEAEFEGQKCGYLADCILTVPDASGLLLYPMEETQYLYLLLENGKDLLGRIGYFQPVGSGSRIDRLLERICYHARGRTPMDIYTASAEVYALLMEALSRCGGRKTEYSPLVRKAIAVIREEFAFLTGVEELGQRLGVTKNHLIRMFTADTGESPGRFLQSVKLDNAKLMLQNRDYSIEMVADMAGYSGANYFCKVFRRATGESPGEYRARNLAPAALDLENQRRLRDMEAIYHV